MNWFTTTDNASHDEDDDDGGNRSSSGKYDWRTGPEIVSEGPNVCVPPPTLRQTGNTGPKGVLADYREAQERARMRMKIEAENTWAMLEKNSLTLRSLSSDSEQQQQHQQHQQQQQKQHQKQHIDDDDYDDDDDDEFVREYHRMRLQELERERAEQQKKDNQPKSQQQKKFGNLLEVSRNEYVDAIDNEAEGVFIVVHLYQPYIKNCKRLNEYLEQLAKRLPGVKFLKIVATEAKEKYDDIALPSLLIYQNQNLKDALIPVTSLLPDSFDEEDIYLLLAKFQVIEMPRVLPSFKARKLS